MNLDTLRECEDFLERLAAQGATTLAEARREASALIFLNELHGMFPDLSPQEIFRLGESFLEEQRK
jgi:hypothetical protein